jgi:hypothetical protein
MTSQCRPRTSDSVAFRKFGGSRIVRRILGREKCFFLKNKGAFFDTHDVRRKIISSCMEELEMMVSEALMSTIPPSPCMKYSLSSSSDCCRCCSWLPSLHLSCSVLGVGCPLATNVFLSPLNVHLQISRVHCSEFQRPRDDPRWPEGSRSLSESILCLRKLFTTIAGTKGILPNCM